MRFTTCFTYSLAHQGEEQPMHDFSGQAALITGAAGNPGVATARAFASAGAALALLDHDQQRLRVLLAHGKPLRF